MTEINYSEAKVENDNDKTYKILLKIPGFQPNTSDVLLIEMLKEEFLVVDLLEEAKKYFFWIMDQPQVDLEKKWNHRSRFRTWVKRAAKNPY